jgi:glutamate formiminotransferase
MDASQPILECVPNFSEGQNEGTITAIKEAISSVKGQKLLHVDKGPAANRTVFTFAGAPEAVVEAAFRSIKTAADRIDMRVQSGAHPRIGATDVCPLIPLHNMTMAEAIYWSEQLAERVGRELNIPVYLYEHSARKDYRRALPDIRKGQYEALLTRMKLPEWLPDYGSLTENTQKTGATVIGARNILVAFNISLNTKDEKIAAAIARKMRTSSKGMLPALRAIGWYMKDYDCAQVSMNLLDYRITSPLTVWQTCKELALSYGAAPTGCEVVGLIPEGCILEAGQYASSGKGPDNREGLLKAGIDYLGLDKVKPFDPREKILEYALQDADLA